MSYREAARIAQELRLSRERIEAAQSRMRAAHEAASHHERAAASERARIATLARTWGLCPECFEPAGTSGCEH